MHYLHNIHYIHYVLAISKQKAGGQGYGSQDHNEGHPDGCSKDATEALDDMTAALTDTIRKQTMVRPRIEIDRSIPDSDGDYKVRRWQDRRKEEAV